MKFLLLILFCITTNLYAADVQGKDWLKDAWYGNIINGKTSLYRNLRQCDAGQQAAIVRKFGPDKATVVFASYAMLNVDTSRNPPTNRKDSLKYFPKLLNDRMSINFDPKKYVVPNRPAMDTSLTPEQHAVLNKMARQQPDALLRSVPAKNSAVSRKD